MTRFFLHIQNGNGLTEDEEGHDYASLAEAREAAVTGARSLMSEELAEGRLDLNGSIDIADEAGTIVLTVPFSEAIAVEGPCGMMERAHRR